MNDYQPLHISRIFNAPRQAVWDAWTQPNQFKQWYMPAPYSVPNCEFDVHVGGLLKIDTQGPNGVIMPLIGEYEVVDEPTKLVLTNAPLEAAGNKLFEIQHTIELTEQASQTVLNITSEILSAGEHADQFLSGMKPGLEQAFVQLADLLTKA